MEIEQSIPALALKIPTEAAAYEYLERLLWNGQPVCPHCGSIGDHHFIKPRNGLSRETSTGKQTERRLWSCADCKKQYSVLTGTIMHGSKVPVRTWLFVIFEFAASKNGLAAREIERKYKVHPKTAWFMMHRIREAMSSGSLTKFVGNVVADETYVGGSDENKHAWQKSGTAVRGFGTKSAVVVTVIDADEVTARSEVIKSADAFTLGQMIRRSADITTATLHTDELRGYRTIGSKMAGHHTVNHSRGEYVTEKSHGTNKAESYFSQLKRSLDGTHHHVSPKHLQRYLNEFDFRYSSHDMTDAQRMQRLMSRTMGKRITYKELKAS